MSAGVSPCVRECVHVCVCLCVCVCERERERERESECVRVFECIGECLSEQSERVND